MYTAPALNRSGPTRARLTHMVEPGGRAGARGADRPPTCGRFAGRVLPAGASQGFRGVFSRGGAGGGGMGRDGHR